MTLVSRHTTSAVRILWVLMVMAVLFQPAGARNRKDKRKAAAAKTEKTDYDTQRRFDIFFQESAVQKVKENYDASIELLRHALEIKPDAPEALYTMSMMLSVKTDEASQAEAERYIRKAVELEPDNYYFQSQLAEYYDSRGMTDSAAARYETMSRRFSDHESLLYSLAEIYNSQNNYDGLIRTLSRLEVQEGKNDDISLRKLRAYSQAGKLDSALVIANELIKSDTTNASFRVVRGGIYDDMGNDAQALEEYNAVLATDSLNDLARLAVMNHHLKKNDIPQYISTATSIAVNERMNAKTRTKALTSLVMAAARGTVDSTAALPACRKIFNDKEPDAALLDLYQSYLTMLKAPADTMAPVWRKLLELAPNYSQVRLKLLQNVIPTGKNEEVAKLCEDGAEYDPDNIAYYFYGGLAHFSLKNSEKALDMMKQGTAHITRSTNSELASDMYAALGDIYHEQQQDSLSFAAYEKSLEYKDDNINALNNYAYFLSLKKKDLGKAESMSLKTIKAHPQNATYLDTYAWVLFELGRYAEAAEFIEQALANIEPGRENTSIYEHAGDIYSMRGNAARALEFWKKAKKMGEPSKLLDKKIKLRKYIAQ